MRKTICSIVAICLKGGLGLFLFINEFKQNNDKFLQMKGF